MSISSVKYIFILLFISELTGIRLASATMGELEESVESDRKNITAIRNLSIHRRNYNVHEISNSRLTVREYASNGVVFGVSWQGIQHPDLSQLLGKYFQEYQESSQAAIKIGGARSYGLIQGQKIVVEKFGHMRWLQGRAYVRTLMPHGVSSSELY